MKTLKKLVLAFLFIAICASCSDDEPNIAVTPSNPGVNPEDVQEVNTQEEDEVILGFCEPLLLQTDIIPYPYTESIVINEEWEAKYKGSHHRHAEYEIMIPAEDVEFKLIAKEGRFWLENITYYGKTYTGYELNGNSNQYDFNVTTEVGEFKILKDEKDILHLKIYENPSEEPRAIELRSWRAQCVAYITLIQEGKK